MPVAYVGTPGGVGTNALPLGTGTIVSASFTPTAGEVLVVKAGGQSATVVPTSVTNSGSAGAFTWRQVAAIASGSSYSASRMWVALVPATVAITVTVTFSNTSSQSGTYTGYAIVERYSGTYIPQTLNAVTVQSDTVSPFGGSITTRQHYSMVTWQDADYNQAGGTTNTARTYVSPGIEIAAYVKTNQSGILGFYSARQTGPSPTAATSFGMTTPTGQSGNFIALELPPLTPGNLFAA